VTTPVVTPGGPGGARIQFVDPQGQLRTVVVGPGGIPRGQIQKLLQGGVDIEKLDGGVRATPPVPTIRVQRSDVEIKLEEIGRDVQSLRQQLEKMTDELQKLQKLQKQLSEKAK
jgi:hypothetical protein